VSHIGIIGSRSLPSSYCSSVAALVAQYVSRGWVVHSGGALGADYYVLEALVRQGASSSGIVHAAWSSLAGFPCAVRPLMTVFIASGGTVHWGTASHTDTYNTVAAALLQRNRHLVASVQALVAYPSSSSRGTWYTVAAARRLHIPVQVTMT